jgi:hypothetical protein
MTTASTHRGKEIAGQIRLKAVWRVIGSTWLGSYLAAAIWKPHDVFYPFPLVFWGLFAFLFLRGALLYLSQLSYAVVPEEARTKKAKARQLMAYILCTAFISCGFMMCLLAAKSFGRLYAVAAVVAGITMTLMLLITEREIKHLACWFSARSDQSPS